MHKPSISILGPGPDVMLIEGFDCIRRLSSGIRGLGSGIGGLGGGNWRLSSSIGGHTGIGDYGGLWCILEYLSSESHHLFVHCTQNPSKCITPLLAY